MNRKQTLAATAAWTLAVLLAPAPALAETLAGTELTTTSTFTFDVEGIPQTPVTEVYTRIVDLRASFTVDVVDTQPITVAPGQTDVMHTLKVKNLSNAPMSFTPQMYDHPDAVDGYPANFYRLYRDTNGNGVYDAGTDEQIGDTGVDGNGPFIRAPLTQPNVTDTWFAFGDIPLTAAALNGQTVNYEVYTLPFYVDPLDQELAPARPSGYDTPEQLDVYNIDADGVSDDLNDGYIGVYLDFLIAAANLSLTRTSKVISDLVNGTTNPKAIPGAVIEYCIAVSNAAGGATASEVVVTDEVGADLTIDESSLKLGGTFASDTCNDDGIAGGSINGAQISGTIPSIAGGETKTVLYRATVN